MDHMGHSSRAQWVTWVMGHSEWPIPCSESSVTVTEKCHKARTNCASNETETETALRTKYEISFKYQKEKERFYSWAHTTKNILFKIGKSRCLSCWLLDRSTAGESIDICQVSVFNPCAIASPVAQKGGVQVERGCAILACGIKQREQ